MAKSRMDANLFNLNSFYKSRSCWFSIEEAKNDHISECTADCRMTSSLDKITASHSLRLAMIHSVEKSRQFLMVKVPDRDLKGLKSYSYHFFGVAYVFPASDYQFTE
ncbi:hypothetical protein MJO29_001281 [Puccinia striiformis f. sp. tritici]|nr:hypothetical protein MJO29_001281 [Puccinia striiformis f. sp. tritici]